jgi:hypothetical protein
MRAVSRLWGSIRDACHAACCWLYVWAVGVHACVSSQWYRTVHGLGAADEIVAYDA